MSKIKRNRMLDNISTRTKGKGIIEDATEFGEFVPSYDVWIDLDEQREITDFLEHLD